MDQKLFGASPTPQQLLTSSDLFNLAQILDLFDAVYFSTASPLFGAFDFITVGVGEYKFFTADFQTVQPEILTLDTWTCSANDCFGSGQTFPAFSRTPVSFLTFDTSFTLTAVPVPAAAWLFGSGFIGLTGVARRKVRI